MSKDQVKDPHEELRMARDCLEDARDLAATKPRIAAREAYLAAFHAAQARLAKLGKPTATHKSVNVQLGQLYQGTDYNAQARLSELENWKASADYGRGTAADPAAAQRAVEDATEFVERMEADMGPLGPKQQLTPAQIANLQRMRGQGY